MGLGHSPSIAANNLILALDPANPKSYSGSGTTVTDISNNNNNGILTNDAYVRYGNLGVLSFDGSNDYAALPSLTLASSFTIEFWFYMSALAGIGYYVLYDGRPASTTGAYVNLAINGATPESYVNGATVISGSPLSANTWYHFAYARSGSSTKMFITDNTNYINAVNRPVIGTNGYILGDSNFNGYIDDLRITKGLARYTANFTPPTQAFPLL